MKTTLNELWNLAIALEKELDAQAHEEANQIALQATHVFEAKLKRLREQTHEFTEAGGSSRDLSALVPLPWQQEGIPFPSTSKECMQAARIYGITQSWTLCKVLHTTSRELEPLVNKALQGKQDTLKEYIEMENRYREPALSWLSRYINHGAGALADFYFGRVRRWNLPYVELAALRLEQVGLRGALKGRDEVLKQEDSPYFAALTDYTGVIDRVTAGVVTAPPPSASAEIFAAWLEMEVKCSATIFMELAQNDSKLRHAVERGVISSMEDCCRQLVAELETVSGEIKYRNEALAPEIDFNMDQALAWAIVDTYKRRKTSAKQTRGSYRKLQELCEEAGADANFVREFAVKQDLLPKLGRPRK